MQNLEELRKTYNRLPDEKLRELALLEARNLRPEAVEVLKAELAKRGLLSPDLNQAIVFHVKYQDEAQLATLVERFRAQPCPLCGTSGPPLNAAKIVKVRGALVLTWTKPFIVLACPDCIRKRARREYWWSIALGWWGFPWGPLHSLEAFFVNRRAITVSEENQPTPELSEWVAAHAAAIAQRLDTGSHS